MYTHTYGQKLLYGGLQVELFFFWEQSMRLQLKYLHKTNSIIASHRMMYDYMYVGMYASIATNIFGVLLFVYIPHNRRLNWWITLCHHTVHTYIKLYGGNLALFKIHQIGICTQIRKYRTIEKRSIIFEQTAFYKIHRTEPEHHSPECKAHNTQWPTTIQ